MLQVPRRRQRLSVALPASLTIDIPHLREKTSRIGMIARTLAIFRVEEAIIYPDREGVDKEGLLLEKILNFQETPQYLRKHLFKKDPDLEFAGVLPPLRSPNHPDKEKPQPGQLREGVVLSTGPASKIDAGYDNVVQVNQHLQLGSRLTIRLTTTSPLQGETVDPNGLHIYWGFKASRQTHTLGELVKKGNHDMTISTSRKGADIQRVMDKLREKWRTAHRPLILFGAPREGVNEILAREKQEAPQLDFTINTLPNQGVETVRTEEALLATLAVTNLLEEAPRYGP